MPLWWTITRQSPGEPKAVSLGPRSIRRESDREAPSAPSRDRFRNLPEIREGALWRTLFQRN